MKGDFTRDTFHPEKRFLRVLMQQGRVQLDADWNEQTAILLHYLQSLAADLIGPHGGPGDGFLVETRKDANGNDIALDFAIRAGHYYVYGILCENDQLMPYTEQPDYPLTVAERLQANTNYLVYLDVWERHVTCVEDDSICEVALGGADTATRAKVVWQVKVTDKQPDPAGTAIPGNFKRANVDKLWPLWVEKWQPPDPNRGQLKAKGREDPSKDTDPCLASPDARYRGAENQLYRVEIHRAGKTWDGTDNGKATAATFKWSRDNGSVIFPILTLEGKEATLAHLGRDDRLTLNPDDWVEIVDDDLALREEPGTLVQVDSVDPVEMKVTLRSPVGVTYETNSPKHPLLRRWDHRAGNPQQGGLELSDGAALVKEGSDDKTGWLHLEDGISIQFQPGAAYRTGDYWLIPARTATGDVEWPQATDAQGNKTPQALPPHGVEHHYAPLRLLVLDGTGNVTLGDDCRRILKQLW